MVQASFQRLCEPGAGTRWYSVCLAYKMASFCQLKYRRVGSVGMTEHSRAAAVPWLSESMISQGRAHQLLPAHPCLPIGKFFVVQTGWWS